MIYFDNASSAFPRSPYIRGVLDEYLKSGVGNISRGQYASAFSMEEKIFQVRSDIASFFGTENPSQVVFSSGATASVNLFIFGFLKKGDHVIISPLEHNCVTRPLHYLANIGKISYSVMKSKNGIADISCIESMIQPNTKAIICNHSSNVSGAIQDIARIGEIAHNHHLAFCVDSSQSAGCVNINAKECNINFLVFTGHKGLLGLPGSGGAIIRDLHLVPYVYGGTGSVSDSYEMPEFLPDRFEAGTQNIPGILSLGCGLNFIDETGLSKIYEHKQEIRNCFVQLLIKSRLMDKIRIIESVGCDNSGILSIDVLHKDNAIVANELDRKYSICTRVGLQCAPLAHRTLGTFEKGGTIRFSFSFFNTFSEVEKAVKALEEICLRI